MIKKIKLKLTLLWLATICLVVFLYSGTLNYYFFQDDFFLFRISTVSNIKSFINFFNSRNDVIFYRPISMQLLYFVARKIFGLNAIYYHLFGITVHILNVYLNYRLIKKISKINFLPLLISFFYGTSGIHFMALAWTAAFHYFIGTFFFLLSFIFFLKKIETNNRLFTYFSTAFFLFALLSEELTIFLPLIIILYCLLFINFKKSSILKFTGCLLPHILVTIIYILYRLAIVPIHFEETYRLIFDVRAVKNIYWYMIWGLNIPEEYKYQMTSFFKINPTFVHDFYFTNSLIWKLFEINIFLIYLLPISLIFILKSININNKLFFKLSLFGLGWFFIGSLPSVFFPYHQYPYLTTISIIGFYIFLLIPVSLLLRSNRIRKSLKAIFVLLIIGWWYFSSLVNIRFTGKTHWIVPRAKLSKIYIEKIKGQFPEIPKGSTLVLPGNPYIKNELMNIDVLRHALMNSEAAFFVYKDPTIRFTYDNFIVPENCKQITAQKNLLNTGYWREIDLKYDQCLKANKIYFLEN